MDIPIIHDGKQLRQIVINLYETGIVGRYGLQTTKIGLDTVGWDFVHEVLLQAVHQVAETWVQTSQASRGPTMPLQ